MPIRQELLNALQVQLNAAAALNLTAVSDPWDIFEAYVFSIILEAARREGATVAFDNIREQPVNDLVFRTSPGRIFRSNNPVQPLYTHARILFPNKPELELHQGIYVSGKSGLLHECDIALLLRTEGITCRQNRVHPRCAKVIFAAECKFYSSGFGIPLARGFLGLTTDIWTSGRFMVSNLSSVSVEKLLTHHDRKWAHQILPGNSVTTNRFRALVERALEEFIAIN
jgi:hypothetical protein